MKCFILITFLINYVLAQNTPVNNYICTNEFCENWRNTNVCPNFQDACRAQNSTYNGLIFPSQTPCSCCPLCLENLKIDEFCTLGQPGAPLPLQICAPGLSCVQVIADEHAKCRPMLDQTPCLQKQQEFDHLREIGEIGHLMQRPECDGDGDYNSVECIPGQTCFCVDKKGKRIFGESIHFSHVNVVMKCECSRLAAKLPTLTNSRFPIFSSRCDERGSYDLVQCVDDKCVCASQNTGEITSQVYNLTLGISGMPCFNRSIHHNTTYMRPCEIIKKERIEDLLDYEENGVNILDLSFDYCQPDGYFSRVQISLTHKFCADRNGKRIEDYAIERDDPRSRNMNCNCARAVELLKLNKIVELPSCCPNGNYKKVACRRGLCYCVSENGSQISQEVPTHEISKLSCYNNGDFCD